MKTCYEIKKRLVYDISTLSLFLWGMVIPGFSQIVTLHTPMGHAVLDIKRLPQNHFETVSFINLYNNYNKPNGKKKTLFKHTIRPYSLLRKFLYDLSVISSDFTSY